MRTWQTRSFMLKFLALGLKIHMRQAKPSCHLGLNLVRKVFVDCCRSLPGRWPFPTLFLQSLRRCLRPYPAVSPAAFARFFREGNGLTSDVTRSAHQNYPCNATSTGKSFLYVQAPTLDRPPGCTHR